MTRIEHEREHGQDAIFSDTFNGKRWKYGYNNRPFAMSHQPRGFIIGSLDAEYRDKTAGIRHGAIEYPFRLEYIEVYNFELVEVL